MNESSYVLKPQRLIFASDTVRDFSYALGILGIVVGTLIAMLLLPDDYYEPGQLQASAIVMSLGLMSGPIVSSIFDNRVWMRAETVMLIGLIYWLLMEPITDGYAAYELTRTGILKAFGLMGFFGALILVGSKLAHSSHDAWSRVSNPQLDFSLNWLYSVLIICSALGLLARLIPCDFSLDCMTGGLLSARGEDVWTRGVLGGSGSFVSHLSYFGYLTVPLTVALHHRTQRIDWRVALGMVLSTIFLLFLIKDGGRRLVGMVLGSGLIAWLLLQPRLRLREIFVAGMCAICMLALLAVMLVFRTREGGIVGGLFSGSAFDESALSDGFTVDNNFLFLVRTLDLIPEFRDHTGWSSIIYWLVRPIPRFLWPGKPTGPGINLPCELDQCWGEGFTLTISAIGDWYIGFGIYSVAIAALAMGFLGGKLVLIWWGPTVRQKLLYSLGLMCLFIGLRSYLELILMSYPILALYVLGKVTMRVQAQQAVAINKQAVVADLPKV